MFTIHSRHRLHTPPPTPPAPAPPPTNPTFQRLVAKPPPPEPGFAWGKLVLLIVLLGVLYGTWRWMGNDQWSLPGIPLPGFSDAPPAPKPRTIEWIPLQSTDGRTIQAHILVITDKSVFIRRDDGQTFDLPLERLTAESRGRIEEYRLSRIYAPEK